MSWINSAAFVPLHQSDKSTLDELLGGESFVATPFILDVYIGQKTYDDGFSNPNWPGGSLMCNDSGIGDVLSSTWFHQPYPVSGANGRLAFVGVTRDQYGSPVGNCTVRCYLTATAELVSTVISDANGAFTITTPFGGAHFLTTHNTGVAGATVDTLIPS